LCLRGAVRKIWSWRLTCSKDSLYKDNWVGVLLNIFIPKSFQNQLY